MLDFRQVLPRTAGVMDATTAEGLQSGCEVYVSVDSVAVADAAFGVRRETILLWLSAGKPIAAVAIALLVDAGLVGFDDPVARHIPEFAARGKEGITIRHLLTHTAGIRWANFQYSMSWEQVIAAICDAPIEPRWIVGQTAGYHALSSWYVLGEIVRRVDPPHRAFETYVRQEIFEPLGMDDCWFTLSRRQYEGYGDRIGLLANTSEKQPRAMQLDREDQAHFCVPGASGRGPAAQLGRFYEMLLRLGKLENGKLLLTTESVQVLTTRQRVGIYDLTFKHLVDWGLGFIMNSAQYGEATVPYGFGPHASPAAFGHGGSQSSIGMADPRHQLAIVIIFNGMPGDVAHQRRMRATLGAIYEDLKLDR